MLKKTHLSTLACLALLLVAVYQRTAVGKVLVAKVEERRWYTASPYQVRMVSTDPFILHLEDFLTWGEQRYLLKLSYVRTADGRGQVLICQKEITIPKISREHRKWIPSPRQLSYELFGISTTMGSRCKACCEAGHRTSGL